MSREFDYGSQRITCERPTGYDGKKEFDASGNKIRTVFDYKDGKESTSFMVIPKKSKVTREANLIVENAQKEAAWKNFVDNMNA